jgi:hypothetical protein
MRIVREAAAADLARNRDFDQPGDADRRHPATD